MKKFLAQFEDFCKTPKIDSGKARSYAKAIEYLCDYLQIHIINEESINYLKSIEDSINDKNSHIYQDMFLFLSKRRQGSYLTKGFIKAALKYLFEYHKNER